MIIKRVYLSGIFMKTEEAKQKWSIDTANTLSRLNLLGELDSIKVGTLITHIGGKATYPFLGLVPLLNGRKAFTIGLWKKNGVWITDSSASLGEWSIALDQNYTSYPHLRTDKL